MPVIRLTKTSVAALKYEGKTIEWFDIRLAGFGVRVNRDSKAYFVQTKIKQDGQWRKIKETLGKVGIIHHDHAELAAERILRDAAAGVTPAERRDQEAAQQRIEDSRDITVRQVFNEYRAAKKKLKPSTADLYLETMERYCPDWLERAIRTIDGNDIVTMHTEVGKRSAAKADFLMRIMRALFNYTMDRHDDILMRNPVRKLTALDAWFRVGRRSTFITPADLPAWFNAVNNQDDLSRNYLLLLIFTGARPDEAAAVKWADVDFRDNTAVLRKTKNGRELRVPVAKFVMALLAEQKEIMKGERTPYVFPSIGRKKSASGHLEDVRDVIKTITAASGVEFMPSDLRRSFLSYCEMLEVPIFTQKRLCNHALPTDVTQGYIQFSMVELRRVVEKVAQFILKSAKVKTKKAPGG